MHDPLSGADFEAGTQRLDGGQALAFARDRKDVPGGDIGRSANHGRLLLSALSQFRSSFRQHPASLMTWVAAGRRGLDTDLSLGALLDLAMTASRIEARHVDNVVVPAGSGTVGSASVVFIQPGAKDLYADMRTDGVIDR